MSGKTVSNRGIISLYVDSRKDQTQIHKKVSAPYTKESIQKEHISLIEKPGSKYFGYIKDRVVLQMQ